MLWIFGDVQGEQPGGVGVWLVQFVLLFLESSSKGHKAASAGGSNTGVFHSWGVKIALYIHQVSKSNSVCCFLVSQVLLQHLGWLDSERGQAFFWGFRIKKCETKSLWPNKTILCLSQPKHLVFGSELMVP